MSDCSLCNHGSIHYSPDKNGNPIRKLKDKGPEVAPEVADSENFWTYVQCKKNFGLPKAAYIGKCPLFQPRK